MIFERIHLEEGEEIVEIIRHHWFLLVKELFGAIVVLFAPLLLYILYATFLKELVTLPDLTPYTDLLLFVTAAWILFVWMLMAYTWTNYYLDLWVITSKRVILINQRGFFRRFVSSFRLERLQDMNVEVNGFIATMLDFGTIEAQTAGGSNEEFISHCMPKPQDIKATIIRFADDAVESRPAAVSEMQSQGL